MEDVMETCWIDSVTMCSRGYRCEGCPKDISRDKLPIDVNIKEINKIDTKINILEKINKFPSNN